MTTGVGAATRLRESTPLAEATRTGARLKIKIISPGWGSSGFYSQDVLEQVAQDGLIPVGTHMYLDHPTATEAEERPERSVRDLAAVTTAPAVWDDQVGALMAESQVFSPFRAPLAEQAPHIGVSIRASGMAMQGEAEGQVGPIITSITEVHSVDFVTAAGRGGEIVALLESARTASLTEARNIGGWLEAQLHKRFTQVADDMYGEGRLTREERIILSSAIGDALTAFVARVEADAPALFTRDIWDEPGNGQSTQVSESLPGGHTANSLRDALADLVKDAYGGQDIWTWVQDYTDVDVLFRVETVDATALYRQTFTGGENGALGLSGDRVEVRAVTTYEPVTESKAPTVPAAGAPPAPTGAPPASPAEPAGESTTTREGDSRMAEHTSDAELASLREAAARTVTLEAQLAEARAALRAAEERASALGENATRMVEAERAREAALAENRRLRAVIATGPVIDKALAESTLPAVLWPRVTATVMGSEGRAIPMTEAGTVDSDKLASVVTAAIDSERTVLATLAETAGAGIPRGLGAAPDDDVDTTADLEQLFREAGMSESAAKLAAKGR